MSETVGAFVLKRLHEHGVDRIYGYPGDGINGVLGGFHEHGEEIEFIQTRHEEIASFAASAHAKFTGEVGVCMATSGPGAIHLLNGLYDAKLDHQPVVALVGQQKTQLARLELPAGGRSQRPVQGRRLRVRPDLHDPEPGAAPDRPRRAGRAGDPLGDRGDPPRGRAGGRIRRPAPRPRLGVLLGRARGRLAGAPAGGGAAPRRRDPQLGREGRDPGRTGRPPGRR